MDNQEKPYEDEIRIIDDALFVCVGEVPKEIPKKCADCVFSRYYSEDVHIGCSCYDSHQHVKCVLQGEYGIDLDYKTDGEEQLFKDCPLKNLMEEK